MASSNRHWPSMFKSKPCNSHHQWQHEINSSLISNGGQRTPQASGCEERSPEPKPRWNPRPEQIRILEAIFNSGMVNPPRDEIRKIRAQLQEYGQVGDANVFYWFQNRKSRSKHKQRHIQTTTTTNNKSQRLQNPLITSTAAAPTTKTTPSSSSSSSEISSQTSPDKALSLGSKNLLAASSSPTPSGNQPFYQTHCAEFLPVPFFFPVQQPPPTVASTAPAFSQGFCFTDAPNVCHVVDSAIENSSGLLLSDLLLMNHGPTKKVEDDKVKLQQQLSYSTITTAPSTTTQSIFSPTSISALSTIGQAQGVGETAAVGPTKSTVFINDVAFEVTTSLFDVREVFGDDAVLLHSSGQPVLTNEWGVTLQPLQHGAFYYLIRTLTSSTHDSTIDLI